MSSQVEVSILLLEKAVKKAEYVTIRKTTLDYLLQEAYRKGHTDGAKHVQRTEADPGKP